jgi:pSer/pThr/pTyr-binding forkhead associated (FHA) protein
MQAKLIPKPSGDPIIIADDLTLVGRHREYCDVVIDSGSISKLHCVIVKTDGLLFVRDLGSTNGTKVNGQRITRGALLPGDELAFAKEKFEVFLGPDVEEASNPDETEVVTEFSIPAVMRPKRGDDDIEFLPDDSAQ